MQLGLTVRVPDAVSARTGYLAGSDAHRMAAFTEAWLDDSVDVMMAARGGYGAHRLLPMLDQLGPSPNPKRIVGFSDITAIHGWLFRRGSPSVHGPVVTQLCDVGPEDLDRLSAVLRGPWSGLRYIADGPCVRGGTARGKLWGGNLAVITALLGTPYAPDFTGTLLVLEDVGEAPYRIDRMLTHLRLAGVLDRVAGVIVGDFTAVPKVSEGHPEAQDVIAERLGDLGVPVLTGFPIGHGSRNQALPLGVVARLDADQGVLEIEEDA